MQQFSRLVSGLSSPAILIVAIWCSVLACVAIGPIDYPGQPSSTVLALVATGVSLFILGHSAGAWCFGSWFKRRANVPAPSSRNLNGVVIATSLIGIGGIGLIALDRGVLSGINNSGYAELLRCAPELVDFIEIRRTPLLYIGYLTFSFGFASLALFLLKGEEIRGWAAIAAQISIVSPIGYALLYSGRMPILFIIVLIVAAVLVRIGQGCRPLPHGHHLFIKMILVVLLFGIYSSAIWSSRQKFCVQVSGLIQEMQQKMKERDRQDRRLRSADMISAADLSKMVDATKVSPNAPSTNGGGLLAMMQDAWDVRPRSYVISAIDSGRLSLNAAKTYLSTYFYLTHGVRIIDTTWRARELFSPHWGVYEIGILSPILRVFFPQNQALVDMGTQLKLAGIHGFFPTVWGAAYIDFGAAGSVVYILIWGFVAGWCASGARRSALTTPPLVLVFILASIFLSPVQGPLGVANSALVLLSMIIVGVTIDLMGMRGDARQPSRELKLGRSVS
jgi:hypothetical protein